MIHIRANIENEITEDLSLTINGEVISFLLLETEQMDLVHDFVENLKLPLMIESETETLIIIYGSYPPEVFTGSEEVINVADIEESKVATYTSFMEMVNSLVSE
jgi:hypothetical protein